MVINVKRFGFGKDSTAGLLSVDYENLGFTCEDQEQEVKVMHETCIPRGIYEIKLRNAGGMNESYKKYPFHKGMLHLQDVPGFEWIYIHVGNNDDHTSGCILVGMSCKHYNGEYTVGNSVDAYSVLYNLVLDAIDNGERIFVEVS